MKTPLPKAQEERLLAELDPGIREYVRILRLEGVDTIESCEGGPWPEHAYPKPTIRFDGDVAEGFRALSEAIGRGLPVDSLDRHWDVINGEPVGPDNRLVFDRKATDSSC